jgi:hypothetical protein
MDDMPWVTGLSDEEIQELRNNKKQLTDYGMKRIRELMRNQEPYPDEMFEVAAKREAENKARAAVDKLYEENGDALKQLAEIEKEERMTEDERIKAMQIACGAIGKYSDALKELAKTEKEELKAELEAKKKENFQLVADACMQEYKQKYGRDEFPEDEYWVYMIGEYFGTGEGQTTCIMMTQAHPYGDDFDKENNYSTITSKQYRAVREFHEQFGTWYLYGLKFLSKEDFFGECAYFIPPVMMKLQSAKCYKNFYTRVHYNFS